MAHTQINLPYNTFYQKSTQENESKRERERERELQNVLRPFQTVLPPNRRQMDLYSCECACVSINGPSGRWYG